MNKPIITFGHLQKGYPIFFINPLDQKIVQVIIKEILPYEKVPDLYIQVVYYAPSTNDDTLIDNDPTLDDLPTLSLLVRKDVKFIIARSKVPTIFCTSKQMLKKWMIKM